MGTLISDKYKAWEEECRQRFDTLKANEEELNKIFIDIYGLQDELTPEVLDKDVTVRLANQEREIKSLISYLIGCLMGRYSLEHEGLIYAQEKGIGFDPSMYGDYVDDDGILPIYTFAYMDDGLTSMLCSMIKRIYGEDTYKENINFIAATLNPNSNESAEEILNKYIVNEFYDNHLKIYQKRPIYWMFSSGKHSAFKCLVYLHRYNKDTLARINTKYFLPRTTWYKNEHYRLEGQLEILQDAKQKRNIQKELDEIIACEKELYEYGQVLDHMANKFIDIELDDGVKANYEKFQNIELIIDGATIKKNLLVPIK